MGLGGVAIAVLPSVVHLQLTFSDRLGGQNAEFCDLAVVTFNNSEVVEYQIRTLEKFFKYPFRYTVFDLSLIHI